MKKVYIHGSYSTANFGDCLLYSLLIDSISDYSNLRNKEIEIISENVSDFCYNFSPVTRVNMFKAAFSANAVICGGGGFFGEPGAKNKYWDKHCLFYHVLPLLMATIIRKPVAIIGTGFGPISNKLIRSCLKKIVSHAKVIAVRNEESKVFLEQLSGRKDIKIYPDWVLSSRTGAYAKETIEQSNRIFLHIGTSNREKMDIMAQDIKAFLKENPQYEIVIGGDSLKHKAIETCKYLYEKVHDERVTYFEYDNPRGLIEMIDSCHYVVTIKLHVGILSVRLGKSVLPLTVHQKVKRFYKQIGYSDRYVRQLEKIEEGDFSNLLTEFVEENYHVDISQIIVSSDNNSKEVHSFLDNFL